MFFVPEVFALAQKEPLYQSPYDLLYVGTGICRSTSRGNQNRYLRHRDRKAKSLLWRSCQTRKPVRSFTSLLAVTGKRSPGLQQLGALRHGGRREGFGRGRRADRRQRRTGGSTARKRREGAERPGKALGTTVNGRPRAKAPAPRQSESGKMQGGRY